MNNRKFILSGIATLFLLGTEAQTPNIVIIYADDMGYGDLAVQNPDSRIKTPNLDRLASEGMRFTNAHSSSGICTPSRYSLLTGTHHWRKFHNIVNTWDASVFDTELTIPEMLKEKSYVTACIGKWHLGWDWSAILKPEASRVEVNGQKTYRPEDFNWEKPIPGGPLDQGFDYYFGDDVPNFPPYAWFENDRIIKAPDRMLETTEKTPEGNWEARPGPACKDWDFYAVMPTLTEKAVQWIKKQKKDQPFFLYFAFTSPHAPIVPSKEWLGKSEAGPYGDFVMQSDHSAGEVIRALKEAGLYDNTLVIFSADNGPETYAWERVRKYGHRSMGPLRGLKRDVWDGGHRIPLIIRWPGVTHPGSVTDELISQTDFMATIAAGLDINLPKGAAADSYDQTALLKGTESGAREAMVHNTFDKYAVQKDNWVYIDAPDGEHSKMPEWFRQQEGYDRNQQPSALYNLKDEISQHQNVIDKYPEKAKELKSLLDKMKEGAVK